VLEAVDAKRVAGPVERVVAVWPSVALHLDVEGARGTIVGDRRESIAGPLDRSQARVDSARVDWAGIDWAGIDWPGIDGIGVGAARVDVASPGAPLSLPLGPASSPGS